MLSERKNTSTNVHKIIVIIFLQHITLLNQKKSEHMYILLFRRF